MKKVIIIGCPGSGKSTFGRKLHQVTGLPLYHLDMLYWNADRTTVTREVFDRRLSEVMSLSEWIIDGNYSRTMEVRLKECDTVFFLDFPTAVCLKGIDERKGQPRSDMPWFEKDYVDDEFIAYIKNFHSDNRPEILRLLEKYLSKTIIAFRSRAEMAEYLQKCH